MSDATLPPFIDWRDGKPRFNPGRAERKRGFKSQVLRRTDGSWMSFEEARAWGEAKHREILAARQSGKRIKAERRPTGEKTVAALLDDWSESAHFKTLAPATQRFYRSTIDAITFKPQPRSQTWQWRARERKADAIASSSAASGASEVRDAIAKRPREKFADTPAAFIGAPELRDFFDYATRVRGLRSANAMIATISAAFTWGRESAQWRLASNPRLAMSFKRPEGRVRLISFEEFTALVKAADERGRASIGDSLYLGLFGGRRQNDRLALKDEGMRDGRRQLRQSKTGKLIPIKDAPQLTLRLDAAKARVAALKLKRGTRPDTIVVFEQTGLPYNETTYRHEFAAVRAEAAKTCPSVATARDQDLRDTCVILLFRAGCNALEICDITGHSYSSVELIRKHYLGDNNLQRADAAIDKLAAYVAKEGKL